MHLLWGLTNPYKLAYCVYINQLTVGKHVESLWVYKHKEVLLLLQNQRKSKECTWTCIDLNKSYYQFFTKGFLSLDLKWFSNEYFRLDIRNYLYKKRLQTFSIRDKFDFITQQIWSHVSIDLNLKIKIPAPKSLKYLRLFWEKYFSLTLSKIFIEVHEMVYAQRTFLKISSAYANNDLLQNTHHCRHNQPCHRT